MSDLNLLSFTIKRNFVKSTMIFGFLLFLVADSYAVNMQFLRYSPVSDFVPSDFEILQSTGLKALNENDDGKESSWKNPETNHSGSITPLDTSTIDGMHCRKTRIKNHSEHRNGQAVFTFCKKENKWKVLK